MTDTYAVSKQCSDSLKKKIKKNFLKLISNVECKQWQLLPKNPTCPHPTSARSTKTRPASLSMKHVFALKIYIPILTTSWSPLPLQLQVHRMLSSAWTSENSRTEQGFGGCLGQGALYNRLIIPQAHCNGMCVCVHTHAHLYSQRGLPSSL